MPPGRRLPARLSNERISTWLLLMDPAALPRDDRPTCGGPTGSSIGSQGAMSGGPVEGQNWRRRPLERQMLSPRKECEMSYCKVDHTLLAPVAPGGTPAHLARGTITGVPMTSRIAL